MKLVHQHHALAPWEPHRTRCGGAGESTSACALVTCKECLTHAPSPLRVPSDTAPDWVAALAGEFARPKPRSEMSSLEVIEAAQRRSWGTR